MKKAVLLLLLLIAQLAFAQSAGRLQRIDSVLTYLHERHLFNGTVLLAEDGKVTYQKTMGLATAETGIPVQISHFKIALRSKWGSSAALLRRLQSARQQGVDVSADVYPYAMWSSTPRVLFPQKDFDNPESALFAARELVVGFKN